MSTSRLRNLGVLGTGQIALEHVRAAQAAGARIVAGSATSQDSPRWHAFAAAAPGARFVADGAALLADPQVDAVIACLPWSVTEAWLPRLLSAPKPVLIEKPLALSAHCVAEALATPGARLADKQVGYNRRFYAPVQALKARVARGGLKTVEVTVAESVGRLAERYGPAIVPHILAQSSSHVLDAALHLFGALRPVRVYAHDEPGYGAAHQSLTGLLETADGVPVWLAAHADDPATTGIRCRFEDRTAWVLSPMEQLIVYQGLDVTEPTIDVRVRRYAPRPIAEHRAEGPGKPGFFGQMQAFVTGQGRGIAATPAESLQVLELIESLQRDAMTTEHAS